MMYAMSIERQISDRLKRLDLSADNFSAVTREWGCYVSGPRLSQAIRGAKDFDRQTALNLLSLLGEIESLVAACQPIPISMKNPQILARLVRELKETPTDLPTLPNLILMNEILAGRELQNVAGQRGISMAQLRERVSEVAVKIERGAWRLTEIVERDFSDANV